jgi:hypothetical protein
MPISRHILITALLFAVPLTTNAQPGTEVRARKTPMACRMAARSVREWGWGVGVADPASTPLASIVSAVNYQLRANAGQLGAGDMAKLKAALASSDPCVRELSLTILATQGDGRASKKTVVRVAQSQKENFKIRD